MTLGIMEQRSTKSYFVENSLWKRLWSFSEIEYVMIHKQERKPLKYIMNYNLFTVYYCVDRDSSVGTATRYWLGGLGIATR